MTGRSWWLMMTVGGGAAMAAGTAVEHALSAHPRPWARDILLSALAAGFAVAMADLSRRAGYDQGRRAPGAEGSTASQSGPGDRE